MNHINQAKALAAKTRLVNLIAAASVGTTALICTGGFAQAGSEAMVSLSIEGRALNQPMPNAIVAVYAGGQKFSTRADAKGAYRLNVRLPANKTAGLVQISAQGVAAQAGLGLVSYPGSFAAMVAQAGRDGVLTVGENPRVQLTAISSAEAALVRDAAGKRPETDEEQASALKAVDVVELLDLAATLQLMASEPAQYRLPKGVPNTLEFLTQRGPREDYVDILQTQAPDILERAQLQLLQDPEQRPAIVAATLPSEMLAATKPPITAMASAMTTGIGGWRSQAMSATP